MKYPKAIIEQTNEKDIFVVSSNELYDLGLFGEFFGPSTGPRVAIRSGGNFEGRAYYLSPGYDWTVAKDDQDQIILIPSREK